MAGRGDAGRPDSGDGGDTLILALANISGAMMIQATVPTAFGLFFAPWLLDRSLVLAGGITALAVAVTYICSPRGDFARVSGINSVVLCPVRRLADVAAPVTSENACSRHG